MSINAHYRKAPHQDISFKKYAVEALGVFILTLVVIVSSTSRFAVLTPLAAALTVGILVYTIGHISGTHINPAMTLALYTLKKITAKNVLGYIIAQVIGALVARAYAHYLFGYVPHFVVQSNLKIILAEAIGTFLLGFGVASVVFDKVSEITAGIVIAGYLLLGVLAASIVSNGMLNPALALGVGSFSLAYLLGPIIGGWAGMWAFKKVQVK